MSKRWIIRCIGNALPGPNNRTLIVDIKYKQLGGTDLQLMDSLLDCFGKAFEEEDTYGKQRPSADYMQSLLESDSFITLVAIDDNDRVIGGLAAYELKKFEQQRSEVYIYDLAVDSEFRRKGIATGLINALKPIAEQKGAWVIFVQADHGDEPAIELYTKLGVREEVLHFDIPIGRNKSG